MLIRAILVVSIALNIALGGWLVTRKGSDRGGGAKELVEPQQQSDASDISRLAEGSELSKSAREKLLAGFNWNQIESADYRQYIANLRRVGCPEEVIADIISADLAGKFVAKAREIWTPPGGSYWQKQSPQPGAKQFRQSQELEKEHAAELKELLGKSVEPMAMIDALFLQSSRQEHGLDFLSRDRKAPAEEALKRAGIVENPFDEKSHSVEARKKLADQKRKALSDVLNKDELLEYEMRTSPIADLVRQDIRFMETTPEEFQRLARLREKVNETPAGDSYKEQKRVAEEVRRVLGEERGKEYARSSDLFYQWSREAAARYELEESAGEEAWSIKNEALAEAERIRALKTASVDERRRRLAELRARTQTELKRLLGPDGYALAIHGDGVWLSLMTEGLK